MAKVRTLHWAAPIKLVPGNEGGQQHHNQGYKTTSVLENHPPDHQLRRLCIIEVLREMRNYSPEMVFYLQMRDLMRFQYPHMRLPGAYV